MHRASDHGSLHLTLVESFKMLVRAPVSDSMPLSVNIEQHTTFAVELKRQGFFPPHLISPADSLHAIPSIFNNIRFPSL